MNNLLLLMFLVSFVAIVAGVIKPSLAIRWGEKRNRKKVFVTYGLLLIVAFSLLTITGCTADEANASSTIPDSENQEQNISTNEQNDTNIPSVEGNMEVHFLDVGQADSILIKAPTGENMLIDAGNNGDSDLVYSYLKEQNVEKLNVVIGTHPHEDHIGSLDTVINNFSVEKVYMPKASSNTKTFKDVLTSIKNKGLKVTSPTPGDTFNLGEAKCTILAPNSSDYDDTNNYSIVLKVQYGNNSFLFTGDAEDVSENEMLSKGYDLKADVLKAGHHGSESSTTESFLDAVSPKHAVICVGKDNKYGHPDNVVLERLKSNNINVYRTDESGTIVVTSDGQNITIDKNASVIKVNAPPVENVETKDIQTTNEEKVQEPEPAPTNNEITVYITNTGSKYHLGDCGSLKKSKIPISLEDAKNQGYGPCGRCHPPQ